MRAIPEYSVASRHTRALAVSMHALLLVIASAAVMLASREAQAGELKDATTRPVGSGCKDCPPNPFTPNPIRFKNGEIKLTQDDLEPMGAFGFTRSYNNQMGARYPGPFGMDWYAVQAPYIVRTEVRYKYQNVHFNESGRGGSWVPDQNGEWVPEPIPELYADYPKCHILSIRTKKVCVVLPPNKTIEFVCGESDSTWAVQDEATDDYELIGNPELANNQGSKLTLIVRRGPRAGKYVFGMQGGFEPATEYPITGNQPTWEQSGQPLLEGDTPVTVTMERLGRPAGALEKHMPAPQLGGEAGTGHLGPWGDNSRMSYGDSVESHTDEYGVKTNANYSWWRLRNLVRSFDAGSTTAVETITLSYDESGPSGEGFTKRRLMALRFERSIDEGPATTIRLVTYEWDGNGYGGNTGNLIRVNIADVGESATRTTHYVYNSDNRLTDVLDAEGWRRLGGDPSNAENVRANAAYHFEYDSNGRVTREVAGKGCSGCSGGSGTPGDAFEYAASGSGGYNAWHTRTVIVQKDSSGNVIPNGVTQTIFTNAFGQPMLLMWQDGSRKWYKYYRYGTSGGALAQVVLEADSAAIKTDIPTGTSNALSDLVGCSGSDISTATFTYLDSSKGMLRYTEYGSATTATPTSIGDVKGYVKNEKIRHGYGGTSILTRSVQYTASAEPSSTSDPRWQIYRVASESVYPYEGSGTFGITTTFDYTWHTPTTAKPALLGVATCETTLPALRSGQHGPESTTAVTTTEEFDEFGNLTASVDARGIRTEYLRDIEHGFAVTRRIDDADGMNLETDFEYDEFDRLIATLEPPHTANDFSNSNAAMTVRRATWKIYNLSYPTGQDWIYTLNGYRVVSTEDDYAIDPVHAQQLDKAGRVTETGIFALETSGSTVHERPLSHTGTSLRQRRQNTYDNQGHLQATRLYRTTSTTTDFDLTEFGYDAFGRQVRQVVPGGTVTRTRYDAGGRVVDLWTGTDDDPDGSDTWENWDPDNTSQAGTNLKLIAQYAYPEPQTGVNNGLDDEPVSRTLIASATDSRVTEFVYDWRHRQEQIIQHTGTSTSDIVKNTFDNLDRVTQSERYKNSISSGNLIGKVLTDYDDRGRVYQRTTYAVNDSGTTGNTLIGGWWYDKAGNVIKEIQPGSGKVFTKTAYDPLGRAITSYTGFDLGTSEAAYTGGAANNDGDVSISGDTVISQTEWTCDDGGDLIQVTNRDRLFDVAPTSSGTTAPLGAPSSNPHCRARYQGMWYDAIGRVIASADYGTNGGTEFDRTQVSTPPTSGSALVTSTVYERMGNVEMITDPAGIKTKRFYDRIGRLTYNVENFDDFDGETGSDTGDPSTTDLTLRARDRATQYEYGANGKLWKLTALDQNGDSSTSDNQVTEYLYDSLSGDSSVDTIASAALLRSVIYPHTDTDLSDDRVDLTYNRLGEPIARVDQNGTKHEYSYDKLGRLAVDAVTNVPSGVDGTVRKITRSFDTRQRLESVTSLNSSDAATSTVTLGYNDFGQLKQDAQLHAGALPSGAVTPTVKYSYTEGASGSNVSRRTKLMHPTWRTSTWQPREVNYLYVEQSGDSNNISDVLSRVAALSAASTRSDESAVVASYRYNGLGQVVKKHYPTPDVRLDYTSSSFAALDQFDRVVEHEWLDVNDSAYFSNAYGFDRASNRTSNSDQRYQGASHAYKYDSLHRLIEDGVGRVIDQSGQKVIDETWKMRGEQWTLDALGNQTQVKVADGATWYESSSSQFNETNEITDRKVRGDLAPMPHADDFSAASSSTPLGWTKVGSDTVSVSSGKLNVSTLVDDNTSEANDPEASAILLFGEEAGGVTGTTTFRLSSGGTVDTSKVGAIFGYKSSRDFWVAAANGYYYHVVDGVRTAIDAWSPPAWPDTSNNYAFAWDTAGMRIAGGTPTGRIGLYCAVTNVQFDGYSVGLRGKGRNMADRWDNHTVTQASWTNAFDGTAADLKQRAALGGNDSIPVHLLQNVRTDRFDVTFNVSASESGHPIAFGFVFNAKDQDNYHLLWMTNRWVYIYRVKNGVLSDQLASNMVQMDWDYTLPGTYRVKFDGDYLYLETPATVSSAQFGASTFLDYSLPDGAPVSLGGGMIGFAMPGYLHPEDLDEQFAADCRIDHVVVKTDGDHDNTWTTELVEDMSLDSGGFAPQQPTYDKAGNLTFDGRFAYKYDAWNRLVEVRRAWREATGSGGSVTLGSVSTGSLVATYRYDGRGRRISKAITSSGDDDATLHFYYDGARCIEIRNGSDQTLKHQVWGVQYVDELLQVAINQDPFNADEGTATENSCERKFWVMQDPNFNVLGLLSRTGRLAERYEYTPYGQRTVFTHGWLMADLDDSGSIGGDDYGIYDADAGTDPPDSLADIDGNGEVNSDDLFWIDSSVYETLPVANDPLLLRPTGRSFRGALGVNVGTRSPVALCEFGHQGLMHEDETGLVYNRARYVNCALKLFLSRDPLEYFVSMNTYEYLRSSPVGWLDPFGLAPDPNMCIKIPGDPRKVNNLEEAMKMRNEAWNRAAYYWDYYYGPADGNRYTRYDDTDPRSLSRNPKDWMRFKEWWTKQKEWEKRVDKLKEDCEKLKTFLRKNKNRNLRYGRFGDGQVMMYSGTRTSPNQENYVLRRPLGTRLWDVSSAMIINRGGVGSDVDQPVGFQCADDAEYLPMQRAPSSPGTSRERIEFAGSEAARARNEAAALVLNGAAAGISEALERNEFQAETWYKDNSAGWYIPGLSEAEAKTLMRRWCDCPEDSE